MTEQKSAAVHENKPPVPVVPLPTVEYAPVRHIKHIARPLLKLCAAWTVLSAARHNIEAVAGYAAGDLHAWGGDLLKSHDKVIDKTDADSGAAAYFLRENVTPVSFSDRQMTSADIRNLQIELQRRIDMMTKEAARYEKLLKSNDLSPEKRKIYTDELQRLTTKNSPWEQQTDFQEVLGWLCDQLYYRKHGDDKLINDGRLFYANLDPTLLNYISLPDLKADLQDLYDKHIATHQAGQSNADKRIASLAKDVHAIGIDTLEQGAATGTALLVAGSMVNSVLSRRRRDHAVQSGDEKDKTVATSR